jgi:CDP-diacylglycerol--serine O-phosphatidyltransferase
MNPLGQALVLSLPLVFSGCVHMAVVKRNLMPALRVPLHREWFGANKTWRGVLTMPLATAAGVWITQAVWSDAFGRWNWFVLGTLLGLAYVLFELPNSFVKRRMGIEPGKRPPRYATPFAIADQADSAVGCALVYWYTLRLPASTVALLIVMGPAVHLVVNYTLYLMRLRKEPV